MYFICSGTCTFGVSDLIRILHTVDHDHGIRPAVGLESGLLPKEENKMDGKVAIAPSEAADFGGTTTPWVDLSAFDPGPPPPAPPPAHHSPPMPDFHGFGFGSAPVMPLEPAYSMSVAPIYSNVMHMSLPAPSWPSMLTAQPAFPDTALSSPPQPVTTAPKTRSGTTPRRTLTDEDRRAMCEYHENNKGAKQTDIGGKFIYSNLRPG